ncbi:hypothetical protein BpHYR1_034529, partial [Brachionus plicatilis]
PAGSGQLSLACLYPGCSSWHIFCLCLDVIRILSKKILKVTLKFMTPLGTYLYLYKSVLYAILFLFRYNIYKKYKINLKKVQNKFYFLAFIALKQFAALSQFSQIAVLKKIFNQNLITIIIVTYTS